tara:strand:- start:22 stop:555 length:534 start_codon:yes stop_codon:yes gene_type:complete
MKQLIKKLLRESLLDEVSDETLNIINTKYSNSPVVMMPGNERGSQNQEQGINYKPISPNEQKINMKPKGLWYGIGNSWIDWVRTEMPEWETEQAYALSLNKSSMLTIRTYEELIEFDKQYSEGEYINWMEVAKKYDGIEIAPYISRARFEILWYYGWDVASGCIWGPNVINDSQIIK